LPVIGLALLRRTGSRLLVSLRECLDHFACVGIDRVRIPLELYCVAVPRRVARELPVDRGEGPGGVVEPVFEVLDEGRTKQRGQHTLLLRVERFLLPPSLVCE
jgi:hypothetical protein